jgi:hypothetical protein
MATNPMVIPVGERYGKLKEFLFEYVEIVAKLRTSNKAPAEQQLSFFFLMYPWLADPAVMPSEQKALMERRKAEITQLGFDAERAKKYLEDILANDKHLAECCPTPLHLANYVDTSFISNVASTKNVGTAQEKLDFAFEEFESLTYHQGRFRRIALSHLFNLDMDGTSASFEGDSTTKGSVRIERIDQSTIPRILGESGFQAFLHPAHAGNCFVVEEEAASSVDDMQWLIAKRAKAYFFAEVLQYFKDGVVHLGYSVPFFLPQWAHQLRRVGLFFLGNPRLSAYEAGKRLYFVAESEKKALGQWWKAATAPKIIEALESGKSKLRQATNRAARYYESSHERAEAVGRLIDVAIGLESLFSPSDQGELNFRIAQSTAQFVGKDAAERQEIFTHIKDMYSRRSKLVHGSYDVEKYEKGEFVTAAEIDLWTSYLRRAYLGFLAIYLRLYLEGNRNSSRDPILERIAMANFDGGIAEKLREEGDIEKLLAVVFEGPTVSAAD